MNFASNAPITDLLRSEGPPGETAPGKEGLATQLLQALEDRSNQIPVDAGLRDDLRKPEKFVSPSGKVTIAATRNVAGHADHFWSLALAVNAAQSDFRKPLEWVALVPRAHRPERFARF